MILLTSPASGAAVVHRRPLTPLFALCLVAAAAQVHAQSQSPAPVPPAATPGATVADGERGELVVTGSVARRRADDQPFAVSVVDARTLRDAGPMINLSEAMGRVPGLVVNLRGNYAQDLQISSRGFGARAGFGVRGLRLYTDGIPATGPDGQGQVSAFDLAGAQRIEVLRGPFSVLYGNSSGGVISLITAPARRAEGELAADAGRGALRQLRGSLAMPLEGGFDLKLSAAGMSIDGFRPQSQAQRNAGNARLGWQGERDRVTLLAGVLDQPADDPLGLTRAQFDTDPFSTAQAAIDFDTRKTQRQNQAGGQWRHSFDAGALRESQLALYAGQREVMQWQAIPVAAQASPRSGGGVVDLDRDYRGAEGRLRWAWPGLDLLAGVALDDQRDARRGFENFTGSGADQVLGVTGRLRRDETNRASSRDLFTQGEFELAPGWLASAGVRSGRVKLSNSDHFLSNGDDSGQREFSYTNPVAGLRWVAWREGERSLQWHASVARGVETPTLGELAYRPDGSGGFNQDLQAQTSRQAELGLRWRAPQLALDASLFRAQAADEIATLTNSGGRSSFQNVGKTLRQGLELSGRWQMLQAWQLEWALTRLDATYQDSFLTCVGSPCTTPNVAVPAGNRIAGTQRNNGWAGLTWQDAVWGHWGLELRGVGRTAVNDSNSDYAEAYALLGLHWRQRFALSAGSQIELLLRLDNLTDRRYAGSVIVNDGNGRFFEPGAPRSGLISVRWSGGL